MFKNLKILPIVILMVGIMLEVAVNSNIAHAGKQDFTIVNNSGKTIYYLYCSATDVWEEDILDDDVIIDGESMKITFPASQTSRYWDLKVVFKDKSSWYWTGLDLFSYSRFTIDSNGTLHYS